MSYNFSAFLIPVSPSLLTMIKNIGVPPKPIHHCAEGHETEGTLLKSSAYINDVESAKLWMTWDFVL